MIDELYNKKGIVEINETIHKEIDVNSHCLGILIYIIIFVVAIPIILYKNKCFIILTGYLPNVDLIANVLTWNGGPYKIWNDLYPPIAITLYGFYSQVFINYLALLGLTFIIAREAKQSNNILSGWTMGFVMILMTYLLPSNLVTHIMNKIQEKTHEKLIPSIIGLISSIVIICFEVVVLQYTKTYRMKLGESIFNFSKMF